VAERLVVFGRHDQPRPSEIALRRSSQKSALRSVFERQCSAARVFCPKIGPI
jgi:hypothetical protein